MNTPLSFFFCSLLGYESSIVVDALKVGAVAAGLSGKGPAVAAVIQKGKSGQIRDSWKKYGGNVIETKINREKAHILS